MPAGRPTKYRPEYAKLAYNYCLLGATNEKLAKLFEVSVPSIDEWIRVHPEFSCALKKGREEADSKVAKSLYQRALGYKHKAVKIFADPKTGAEKIVEYIEHYPPDTAAAFIWLKNRAGWRDKTEVEHSGSIEWMDRLALASDKADKHERAAKPATH